MSFLSFFVVQFETFSYSCLPHSIHERLTITAFSIVTISVTFLNLGRSICQKTDLRKNVRCNLKFLPTQYLCEFRVYATLLFHFITPSFFNFFLYRHISKTLYLKRIQKKPENFKILDQKALLKKLN